MDQTEDQPGSHAASLQRSPAATPQGAQLAEILDHISDALCAIDEHWSITYVNHTALQFYGRRRSDLIGKNLWDEFPLIVGTEPYRQILDAMQERQATTLEYLSPTFNRWLDLRIFPNATGLILHFNDITRHKQVEGARRASEERFRLLFEHSPDAIWVLDYGAPNSLGVIVECNGAVADMHGYSRDELIGREIGMFVVLPEDPERFRSDARGLENFRRTGVSHGQDRHRRKDGTVITIEYVARAISLNGRDLVLAVERDITAYEQAEEARERLLMELRIARDVAEQASSAKTEFLRHMSHELRTPLTTILGFADLMAKDSAKPEHEDYLSYITSAGEQLLTLVNDVLELSRAEAGCPTILLESTSIAQIVRESVQLVAQQANERGISIHVQHEQDEQVLADPQRFHQALANLLSNAIKYNYDAGQVSVTWTRKADRVRINVQDTGPGIPQDLIPRLFIPFEQLGADKRVIGGIGLGLALSKQFVEWTGGTVGVEGGEGQGATFWAELLPASEKVAASS